MKHNILKIFTALIAAVYLAPSCADLDLPSDGRLTLDEIFSEYFRTRNYFDRCRDAIPQTGFSYENTPLASFSDEAHDASDGISGGVFNWYNNFTSPFVNPLGNPWETYFVAIHRCNTFLQCIQDPDIATANINGEEKNGWIGEVYTLRAFYYLQLIKRYGGVPLISATYDINYDFSQDSRATFEECVDFILADCDAALAIPESSNANLGFRWNISDNERGHVTRAFAYAVKSQAALYAASPLWFTSGSKYTYEKAVEITKEALDQCLAHGFELFNITPDEDVAQNAYAYYFILRSDPSRSVDKETIFETTTNRTNVWKWAATPITEGAEKAGPGPSQELVDAYNMQATGEMPVLGYSDADHLNPTLNPVSGYNPAKPYEGRDPRFYASVYYNNSPRSLTSGKVDKYLIPTSYRKDDVPEPARRLDIIPHPEEEGDVFTVKTTGGDPYFYTTPMGEPLQAGEKRVIAFEYKSAEGISDAEFFYCTAGGPEGGKSSGQSIRIPAASEWTRFEFDLADAISQFGYGVTNPANHFLRVDITGNAGYEITIRDMRYECFTPPPSAMPVETFVDGNCGISDNKTERRYTRTGYYMRKFNNYKSNVNVDADGLMKVFRLGELYLNFAEAAYNASSPDQAVPSKVGGASMSARQAVNAVRARVQMPELPAGLSKSDFELRYRNERQVELAFEEHRFFDVRRWKILNRTDGFVTGMKITKDGDDFVYNRIKLQNRGTNADKYLMYPIDQNEVAKMDSFTGQSWQNPGW